MWLDGFFDITCIRLVDVNICLYNSVIQLWNYWEIIGELLVCFYEYWFMSPRGIFTNVGMILHLLDCLGQDMQVL